VVEGRGNSGVRARGGGGESPETVTVELGAIHRHKRTEKQKIVTVYGMKELSAWG